MNPMFNALGGNSPMLQQFQRFMSQMQGEDPDAIINEMVQSGKISQAQLNQAQQQAQQMQQMFAPLRGMFGK